MNRIESCLYSLVYKHPSIKLFLRNVYQNFFDLFPRAKETVPDNLIQLKGCYFGFHDLPQISPDDSKILVLKNHFDGRMPKQGETEEIGYYDLTIAEGVGLYHHIADTSAWNFHKGCREQWLDNGHIIFNTFENGRLSSRIASVLSGDSRVLGFPVDYVNCRRQVASTFSFGRLEYCMPGYGYPYPYEDDSYLDEDAPSGTGLSLIDLNSGQIELLISIKDIASSAPSEFSTGYIHFVTHSEFSPDGRYVSFLHRWIKRGSAVNRRWTRLMVYDLDKRTIAEMPSQFAVSHYVWNEKNQIIASSIIDGICRQVLYDVENGTEGELIAPDVLNSDGHQTIIGDDEFITDTYPDRRRIVRLYRVRISSKSCECIAALYSPPEYQTKDVKCHIACDLHPRLSYSKRYLTFDSPRDGIRSVYIMKMK